MDSLLKLIITGGLLGIPVSTILFMLSPQAWYLIKFPVCFLHELSHFLVALLLGGRPRFPSFILKFQGREVIPGTVRCERTGTFNALPIGLAPLLLWLIPIYLLKRGIDPLVAFILSTYLSPEGLPSGQDLKVALLSKSALLWGLLFLMAWLCLPTLLTWLPRIKAEVFVF